MSEHIARFEKILQKDLGPHKKVRIEKIDDLISANENYMSHVYKVEVTLKDAIKIKEEKTRLHLVVKVVKEGISKEFLAYIKLLFSKEIGFYSEILPTLKKFQVEHGSKGQMDYFATCISYKRNKNETSDDVDETGVIIFENLKFKGYSNIDRNIGFDLEGAKLVLKDLARFHALTIALKLKNPDVYNSKVKKHCKPAHFPKSVVLRKIASKGWFEAVLNQEKCIPYLDQMTKRLNADLDNMNFVVSRRVNEPYATLMHNDMWTNNTMQIVENGKLIKNKFVDFQAFLYASPFCDLIFFIWCSVQIPVIEKHYDELVKHYHHHFLSVLEHFGCETHPFEYEKILEEIRKDAPSEIIHILYLAAIVYIDKGEGLIDLSRDVDEFMSENISEDAAKRIQFVVSEFGRRGWIELK